jgi:site-specific recombinase XerD
MPEKRVHVWVQEFKDRPSLMLQWIDPDTGKRKSRSAETNDPEKAEEKRGDLESDLNNGRYQEASRMSWETFRERFEADYVAGARPNTQVGYRNTMDLFERFCKPGRLSAISERTLSAFVTGMRKEPTRKREGMMPSTIKVRLQFLQTALRWAVDQGMLVKCPRFPKVKVPEKLPERISSASMSDRVVRLARLAGVRLTMHTLRKGFGCRYAGKVPAQVLQKLMRHRNIKTTMDYYANVDDAVMEAVLGPQCNSSRNTRSTAQTDPKTTGDVTRSQEDTSTSS